MKSAFLFLLLFISSIAIAQKDSLQTTYTPLNIYKFNFFSPLFGHTMVSFEKQVKVNRSIEVSLSLIGAGVNRNKDITIGNIVSGRQMGAALGIGYRYYLPKSNLPINMSNSALNGLYVKPTMYIGYYYDNPSYNNFISVKLKPIISVATLLEMGLQLIVNKTMAIDFYGGVGYGFVNNSAFPDQIGKQNIFLFSKSSLANQYTHFRFGRNAGIAFSGGFRIGMVRKVKN